jgi:hypothetical protein
MPQLEKGGKFVFGWACVSTEGRIKIPPEAVREYNLEAGQDVLLINGSRTSGGFGLSRIEILGESTLGQVLRGNMDLLRKEPPGTAVMIGKRTFCLVKLTNAAFRLPQKTLESFGTAAGGKLLVGRGSGFALGFIARGPIFSLAEKHPELLVF